MSTMTNTVVGYADQLDAFLIDHLTVVHLYTNDPVVTPALLLGDLVEAAYAGYAPVLIRVWTPSVLRTDRAVASAEQIQFRQTSGPTGPPIRGFFLTDGDPGPLLAVWRRPGAAFPMIAGGDALVIDVVAEFPVCA